MKIRITYGFYTDGDFSLRDPEKFGCTGIDVEIEGDYYDYVGTITFENDDIWKCKYDAKRFLEKFLCDGIHVSYTHYWLLKDFYDSIMSLIEFIEKNNTGEFCEERSGNYDGTYIKVEFL